METPLTESQLLDLCLVITGKFENGVPQPTALSGNGDGEGISCGILQWNTGQGTLQKLVARIGASLGWGKAESFFKADIQSFSLLDPKSAVQFAHDHFLDAKGHVTQDAATAWKAFLATPESIEAQRHFATAGPLHSALALGQRFMPEHATHPRVVAFFFDLVNQQGSMRSLEPKAGTADAALALASQHDAGCAALWHDALEPLSVQLLFLAHARAVLGRQDFVWDALSRRGTIATRCGIVHGGKIDLKSLLP